MSLPFPATVAELDSGPSRQCSSPTAVGPPTLSRFPSTAFSIKEAPSHDQHQPDTLLEDAVLSAHETMEPHRELKDKCPTGDVQCFYCLRHLPLSEEFVLCETCRGFVSCLDCWSQTEQSNYRWTHQQLINRKQHLLTHPHHQTCWPRLGEHEFDMTHADWTGNRAMNFAVFRRNVVSTIGSTSD